MRAFHRSGVRNIYSEECAFDLSVEIHPPKKPSYPRAYSDFVHWRAAGQNHAVYWWVYGIQPSSRKYLDALAVIQNSKRLVLPRFRRDYHSCLITSTVILNELQSFFSVTKSILQIVEVVFPANALIAFPKLPPRKHAVQGNNAYRRSRNHDAESGSYR